MGRTDCLISPTRNTRAFIVTVKYKLSQFLSIIIPGGYFKSGLCGYYGSICWGMKPTGLWNGKLMDFILQLPWDYLYYWITINSTQWCSDFHCPVLLSKHLLKISQLSQQRNGICTGGLSTFSSFVSPVSWTLVGNCECPALFLSGWAVSFWLPVKSSWASYLQKLRAHVTLNRCRDFCWAHQKAGCLLHMLAS